MATQKNANPLLKNVGRTSTKTTAAPRSPRSAVTQQPGTQVVNQEPVVEKQISESSVNSAILSDQKRMKAKLDSEPLVRIHIPLQPGEKKGAFEPVVQNGHVTNVPKGQFVDVPESVGNILAKSMGVETELGADMRIDLDETKSDALS